MSMTEEEAAKYPQHAKLDKIPEDDRNAIGEFLEWLGSQGYTICRWQKAGNNGEPYRIYKDQEAAAAVLAEYHDSDHVPRSKAWALRTEYNPAYESWGDEWRAIGTGPERWLAEFYGIDQKALAAEKQDMYELLVAATRKALEPKLVQLDQQGGA